MRVNNKGFIIYHSTMNEDSHKNCQQLEDYQKLTQNLSKLRGSLSLEASDPTTKAEQLRLVQSQLVDLRPSIQAYIKQFGLSVADNGQKSLKGSIFDVALNNPPGKITSNIYLWQLFNFVCINSQHFPSELASLVPPLLNLDLSHEHLHSPNSLKNAMIFLHNWLARHFKAKDSIKEWVFFRKAIQMLVGHQFLRDQKPHLLAEYFKVTKEETHYLCQMQWLGYIFRQLFDRESNISMKDSLLRELVKEAQDQKASYYFLHTLGNYFENIIEKRVTTELVAGFPSPIQDVREMYNKQDKNTIQISLSIKDLQFITEQYKSTIGKYKAIVGAHVLARMESRTESGDYMEQWGKIGDCLTEVGHLLSHMLFMGGYNAPLQNAAIELLLEQDNYLLDYLQLSYLLYRNIQSTRYKSKVQMISAMETQAKKKLLRMLDINAPSQPVNPKDLDLERVLVPGQLVLLLRLLSNLVHVSHRGQAPFEKDPKYLHMIMSLTHDSVSQATMKEWAIMFIRNVTEWSEKLREQIQQIKIEMKVE